LLSVFYVLHLAKNVGCAPELPLSLSATNNNNCTYSNLGIWKAGFPGLFIVFLIKIQAL
jgi:hypothetical protein